MKKQIMRIAIAQINPLVGDSTGNAKKIISYIHKAGKYDADIVVFPELSLSGYPPEDLLFRASFVSNIKHELGVIAAECPITAIIGFPWRYKGKLYNAAALVHDGSVKYVYCKINLPNFGVFDEKRYFSAGDVSPIISFGPSFKMGMTICRDIWENNAPYQHIPGSEKIDLIINLSASPYHAGKIHDRHVLLRKRARALGACYVYCNMVGGQDELVFDGGSMAVDRSGKVIARAKQFSEDLVYADLPVKKTDTGRRKAVKRISLPPGRYRRIVARYSYRDCHVPVKNQISGMMARWEEIYQALVVGLKDYVVKNRFSTVVLGLSGGIDSSLTAAVAVDALGKEKVVGLTMPSVYSSKATRRDASQMARNLGIRFESIPIQPVYRSYMAVLRTYFNKTPANITEENLQARIRGNILMAFSNKFKWMVLTTGNKSEIGVGYCTLYGDTAGGFAVLKDVPKTWVYRLAEYRNSLPPEPVMPQSILKRPPTAELRHGQKDQDSLPPYDILDSILEEYVEKRKDTSAVSSHGLSKHELQRITALVDNSEYKRRQSPPGIKISPLAFGKDRRMPITFKK